MTLPLSAIAFSLIEKFRFVLANGSSVIYDASGIKLQMMLGPGKAGDQ